VFEQVLVNTQQVTRGLDAHHVVNAVVNGVNVWMDTLVKRMRQAQDEEWVNDVDVVMRTYQWVNALRQSMGELKQKMLAINEEAYLWLDNINEGETTIKAYLKRIFTCNQIALQPLNTEALIKTLVWKLVHSVSTPLLSPLTTMHEWDWHQQQQSDGGIRGLEMPVFSVTPSHGVIRVGEALLMVAGDLERGLSSGGTISRNWVFQVVKEADAALEMKRLFEFGNVISPVDSDECEVVDVVVESVALLVLTQYLTGVMCLDRLSKSGAGQVMGDLGYLFNILGALGYYTEDEQLVISDDGAGIDTLLKRRIQHALAMKDVLDIYAKSRKGVLLLKKWARKLDGDQELTVDEDMEEGTADIVDRVKTSLNNKDLKLMFAKLVAILSVV
jgi:hypothetical protein